ncbi:drug resistance MFS transporter, drug:H+ antiporter-2 (14 Spanner) (DHA2) family [Providencia stuartii]|nr:drug resistance MFS transporter, drug:H+ antiporter-2 (14 Spanner) (DHA2) family [Providencia stuartii]
MIFWPKQIGGGMALKSVSLVLLYIGVVQGEMLGWYDSGLITACLIASVALFAIFIIRAFSFKQTFAHPSWLMNRNLFLCFVVSCLYGFLMLANSLFIPSFLITIGGIKTSSDRRSDEYCFYFIPIV